MKNSLLSGLSIAAFASVALAAPLSSGLNVGEYVSPFHPTHVSGPDKGTDTCPPCKYGNLPAVQAWFNQDSEENVMALARTVSSEVKESSKDLKGFMIMVANCAACEAGAKTLGAKAETKGLKNVAVAYIGKGDESIKNYKINLDTKVKNTVIVYNKRQVVAKFVNLKGNEAGIGQLKAALAAAQK